MLVLFYKHKQYFNNPSCASGDIIGNQLDLRILDVLKNYSCIEKTEYAPHA